MSRDEHRAGRQRHRIDDPTAVDWQAVRRRRRRSGKRKTHRRRRWAWASTYVVTLGATVVGGSGLLARWSPPVSEWWPQIASLALPVVGPLALPAAVAVGVAARRGRRFGGGVCTVALAALFTAWAFRTSSPAGSASAEADGLRVTTLNIGASGGREGDVVNFVDQTRPDVLLLQEAGQAWTPYTPNFSATVARLLTLGEYRVYNDPTRGPLNASRQVTLTRLPVRSFRSGFLGAREARAGLYSRTVVVWQGREVAVYNVHLQAFNPEVGWSWERALDPEVWAATPGHLEDFFAAQASEVTTLVQMLRAETLPTIAAGDFNAVQDEWSRGALTRGPRALREVTGRWLPAPTRPDETPLVNVDGILVGSEWRVAQAGVGAGGLSDHRPVSAVLSFE